MKIEFTNDAITWFKDELDLPEDGKVLRFFVRYGGEFQLKQGFSPAFNVDYTRDIDEIGYEEKFDGIHVIVAEKDVWYFENHHIKVDIKNDDVLYEAELIES